VVDGKKEKKMGRGGRCGGTVEEKKERIKKCIERLSAIPPNEGKFEWRQKKIKCLNQKLAWLESHGDEIDATPHWKKPRREHVPLNPEKKEKIELTKAKIRSLKDTIFQLKGEIRNRKTQYPEVTDQNKEQLAREIVELKQQKKEVRGQLILLRQEIHQLWHQN